MATIRLNPAQLSKMLKQRYTPALRSIAKRIAEDATQQFQRDAEEAMLSFEFVVRHVAEKDTYEIELVFPVREEVTSGDTKAE